MIPRCRNRLLASSPGRVDHFLLRITLLVGVVGLSEPENFDWHSKLRSLAIQRSIRLPLLIGERWVDAQETVRNSGMMKIQQFWETTQESSQIIYILTHKVCNFSPYGTCIADPHAFPATKLRQITIRCSVKCTMER